MSDFNKDVRSPKKKKKRVQRIVVGYVSLLCVCVRVCLAEEESLQVENEQGKRGRIVVVRTSVVLNILLLR